MWKAFLFGVIVAGAIGPIALLIFGIGAKRGFAAGAFAGLGASLADFLYALAALTAGALVLPYLAAHERAIQVGCGALLVAFGIWMLFSLRKEVEAAAAPAAAASAFLPTFLLTALNPMTLVLFAGFVPQLPVAGSLTRAVILAFALAAGSASVGIAIAGSGAAVGRALPGDRARRAVTAVAALGILAFGTYGIAGAL
jgi:threonine/homoserine/homoserine lactone efflux protein